MDRTHLASLVIEKKAMLVPLSKSETVPAWPLERLACNDSKVLLRDREGDGSKCQIIEKIFVNPLNPSENILQTCAKDPEIFTDPLQFHRFHTLLTGQYWGHFCYFS